MQIDAKKASMKTPILCALPVFLFVLGRGESLCEQGHSWSEERGCVPCEEGKYALSFLPVQESSAQECYSCMTGTYSSSKGSTACDACGTGTFSNVTGSTSCIPCPQGWFQYASGSSVCFECQPGAYQGSFGGTACHACLQGNAQPDSGQSACLACSPGMFSWNSQATACIACSSGFYLPLQAGTACIQCEAGKVQSLPGESICAACGPGSFQPSSGQIECILCAPGEYQDQKGSVLCKPCPEGTYQTEQGQTTLSTCKACPSGTYSSQEAVTSCSSCPPGSFRNHSMSATQCAKCPTGMYQTARQASECIKCQPGSFASEAGLDRECRLCGPGKYSASFGAQTSETCLSCASGLFSTGDGLTDNSSCKTCERGFFPAPGQDSCLSCPSSNVLCVPGSPLPVTCGDGLMCNGTHMDAGLGLLPFLGQKDNLWYTQTIICPRGTVCARKDPILGKGILEPWPQQVHFVVTPDGKSYRVEWPFDYSGEEPVYWLQPEGCKEGWFLQEDSCVPCPNGTASSKAGQLDIESCVPCEAGSFSQTPGQTSCARCSPGTFAVDHGLSVCTQCEPGNFQDSAGSQACLACPPGYFSFLPQTTACTACSPGTAQSKLGQTSCNACAQSSEYSGWGDARCLECGKTPKTLDPAHNGTCHLQATAPAHSLWVNVRGQQPTGEDQCLILANSTTQVSVLRLDTRVQCKHRLRVAGRKQLDPQFDWQEEAEPEKVHSLRVVPYNTTFYLPTCRQEGFGVWVAVLDDSDRLIQSLPQDLKIWMNVLDPAGHQLLYKTLCAGKDNHRCHTLQFCPTMDVYVHVQIHGPRGVVIAEAGVLMQFGKAESCPPSTTWTLALELEDGRRPYLPGQRARVGLRVLNAPTHVQAFEAILHIPSVFALIDFQGSNFTSRISKRNTALVLEIDTSESKDKFLQFLGVFVLEYNPVGGMPLQGLIQVLHVEKARFVLVRDNWLQTAVSTQGFVCGRSGRLEILVDFPRPTTLVTAVPHRHLINWRTLHKDARIWPGSIQVIIIGNTPGFTPQEPLSTTCASLDPGVVKVNSCSSIEPVSTQDALGCVLVRHADVQAVQCFRVLAPVLVKVEYFAYGFLKGKGRLSVIAQISGVEVEITKLLFPLDNEEDLTCENRRVSLFPIRCMYHHIQTGGQVFLLSGHWTSEGSFLLNPSVLSAQTTPVIVLGSESPLQMQDTSRIVFDRANGFLHLQRHGSTPRCVRISESGDGYIPVIPPAPTRLEVQMQTGQLVVQQDQQGFFPTTTRVTSAIVVYSDGSEENILDDSRLHLAVEPAYLRVVDNDRVQTLAKSGSSVVTFSYERFTCLSARFNIQIHEKSVTKAHLLCKKCPAILASQGDPLSQEWPNLFPSGFSASAVVVQYTLADGSALEEWDALLEPNTHDAWADMDGTVSGPVPGNLTIQTKRTGDQQVVIPVIDRWATGVLLMCNGVACDQLSGKLAPTGDPATESPFNYASQINFSWLVTLYNASQREFEWLPGAIIHANDQQLPERSNWFSLTAPGKLLLRVEFSASWKFEKTVVQISLEAHNLRQLSLDGPDILYRIHCTRVWQMGLLSLSGVLSDGRKGQLELSSAQVTWDGPVQIKNGVVRVQKAGSAQVNVTLAGLQASLAIRAVLASQLFTTFVMPKTIPRVWSGQIGATLSLQGDLLPAMHVQDPAFVQQRVVRWRASEQGVIEFSQNQMRLLSDFYDPIRIYAIIRTCQGSDPVILERFISVNVIPSLPGQVDFGLPRGKPIMAGNPGLPLEIPLFLYARPNSPLVAYEGHVFLPGLFLDEHCQQPEFPFSSCTTDTNRQVMLLSGNFPQSQRTGRIHIGTLRGVVELDSVSRLWVAMKTISFAGHKQISATYQFAIKLGRRGKTAIQPAVNTYTQEYLPPPVMPGWRDPPHHFSACCAQLVAGPSSPLSSIVPVTFQAGVLHESGSLLHWDPRLRVEFDEDAIAFDLEKGAWLATQQAPGSFVTRVQFTYVQPRTLDFHHRMAVNLTFAEARDLLLTPPHVQLERLHCVDGLYETRQVRLSLVLVAGGDIDLWPRYTSHLSLRAENTDVLAVDAFAFTIQGLQVGSTRVIAQAFGLSTAMDVQVLGTDALITQIRMPSPYILSGNREELRMTAFLQKTGQILSDLSFFRPVVSVVQKDDELSCPLVQIDVSNAGHHYIKGIRNSHPDQRHILSVELHPCSRQIPTGVTDLVVHLQQTNPVDIHVTTMPNKTYVTLQGHAPISAVILSIQTDKAVLNAWSPGPDMPLLAETALNFPDPGNLIMAGVFARPVTLAHLFAIDSVPFDMHGVLDACTEDALSTQFPISAGVYGCQTNASQNRAAAVNSCMFLKDIQPRRLLQLATGQAVVVESHLYSNQQEISVMFRVLDRFFEPKEDLYMMKACIRAPPPSLLGLLVTQPEARSVDGVGVFLPAQPVVDGWYAVQVMTTVPISSASVAVSYELVVSPGGREQTGTLQESLVTGRELHGCPRYATDKAVFQMLYRLRNTAPPHDLQASLACVAHVVPRRIEIWGPTDGYNSFMFSVKVESFIRMHQVHQAIMNHSAFAWAPANRVNQRRLLESSEPVVVIERVGLKYVNDTADQPVSCPTGMYFSVNGTYERLPLHAVSGPDCYGVFCNQGYVLINDRECAPESIPLNLIWICSIVISGVILVMICVLCALYMSRARRATLQQDDKQATTPNNIGCQSSQPSSTEPFLDDDDDPSFKNILTGVYLDEHSASMLDDDFACIPLEPHDYNDYYHPAVRTSRA